MKSTYILMAVACVAAGLASSGCRETVAAPQTQMVQQPAEAKAAPRKASLDTNGGKITQRVWFPNGSEEGAQLLVEKTIPAEVPSGRPFEYSLVVTNASEMILDGVSISEWAPSGTRIAGEGVDVAGPEAATFKLGRLNPGQSKTLSIKATPSQSGALTVCNSAAYTPIFCMTNNVTNPQIKVAAAGPSEVLVCDPFKYTLTVTNTGVGVARDVKVQQNLPQGLTTTDGRNSVAVTVGELAAGASKSYEVAVKAARTGSFATKASASATGGLAAESSDVTTAVKQPVLAITKSAAEKIFVGQQATYEIAVTNKGNWAAKDAVVTDTVPAGAQFVSATDGGTFAADKVTWSLGTLQPGATRKVSVVLSGRQISTIKNTATASAYCADAVAASAQTAVLGIPAILLEVVDSPDPVFLGTDTTYTIVVTNQGSAPGTNIKVVADVEEAGQIVSTGGDSPARVEGNKITFAPIASLAPKAKATLTVTVKAQKVADSRFKASMTSDQIGRPVEETEATNFYR